MPGSHGNLGSLASQSCWSQAYAVSGSPFPQTGLAPIVLLSFALAIIGAELATVFNNAMMPSLVSHRRLGTLSGIGWATGYVGGW